MNKTYVVKSLDTIIKEENAGTSDCPIPVSIIPNMMGINLCSVDSISWVKIDDGQLTELTIHFLPNIKQEQ